MSNDLFSSCAEQYIDHLEVVRRLSPHTVAAYRRDLAEFDAFCKTKNLYRIGEISAAEVRLYSAKLHAKGLSGASLQRKLSSIRGLYNFYSENIASSDRHRKNPALNVKAPKTKRKLPKPVDVDQLGHLLNQYRELAAQEKGTEKQQAIASRNYAILELLYGSGMRLAELCSLTVDCINLRESSVSVTGKGSKQRFLPLGSKALSAIQAWLKLRGALMGDTEQRALFLAKTGAPISHRSIQQLVNRAGAKLPNQENLHPHKLRHSYASHILESSQDLRAVQELLGHASISTTQVYTHIDFQQLSKAYDNFHPKAQRREKDRS